MRDAWMVEFLTHDGVWALCFVSGFGPLNTALAVDDAGVGFGSIRSSRPRRLSFRDHAADEWFIVNQWSAAEVGAAINNIFPHNV